MLTEGVNPALVLKHVHLMIEKNTAKKGFNLEGFSLQLGRERIHVFRKKRGGGGGLNS